MIELAPPRAFLDSKGVRVVSFKSVGRGRTIVGGAMAVAALLTAQPARSAAIDAEAAVPPDPSGPTSTKDNPEPIGISIGVVSTGRVYIEPPIGTVAVSRADVAGRPTYFARSAVYGWSGLLTFSDRPIVATTLRLLGSLSFGMPVVGAAITSGFGMRHHPITGDRRAHSGIDLAAPTGSPIVATSDGIVSMADWNGGYGLLVALEHGSGLQTRYGHLSRLNVTAGQKVRKGDIIGLVGSTGRSTGPHLHYEMRINGQAINPRLTR